MRPIIEFCASNTGHGTEALKAKLEQNPEYDVIEYGCLSNCGQCYLQPFAMVDGEIIEAESPAELEEAIEAAIQAAAAWDSLEID
ncbi:YuzB family protein [Paenibacillus sp. MMS20-IR301]|uniref:YuzB family protein n=1 Tax=Paenibacillus sp. MMS20-IR301 TaxID=2895946 RepID=UPI0028E3D319|nr:YuzB family protein [Paenibacillus sp. MMS20-IR301]WNS43259.1 YuzB family protein [Paenibacillus sp. MMS20-IR301]